jgi:small conductance mechanosensitive channel
MIETVKDAMTKSEQMYLLFLEYLMTYGLKIIAALLVILCGFWLANRFSKVMDKKMRREHFDATIVLYLTRIFGAVLKIIVVIIAASILGIETTSFVAVLGAAGLAVGLALQGSLANLAGGVLILVLRPFRVGDFIIAQDHEGVVSTIDIFYTTLTRLDNRRVILPNGPLIGNVITNSTAERTRRVDVSVGIAYNSDIDKAERILLGIARQHALVLQDPEPLVGIMNFGDSSINLTFRVWCLTDNYWTVYFDLHKQTKKALDEGGISIPFPQREIRILNEKSELKN